MSENNSFQEAQDKINELLEAANARTIIPIRLPGQIEEIVELLRAAQQEHREELTEAKKNAGPADMESYMKDEAYFVGHAVHELRTPMTSIRGYADMLANPAMGEINDMQKQFVDVIRNNAKRMEKLLSEVSYINKIRKGTLPINKKMDMFKNIAMRVEKEMQPVADELNRQLEFDVPQGLPLLNVDGDLLSVAINKMVENALRYSAEGEGKVVVSGAADGNVLVITISDNGMGMKEDEVERLGEIYFRSDDDRVREFKGSGLGIPIAYGMLELIGADVAVESVPEEGTTFTIRIEGMA